MECFDYKIGIWLWFKIFQFKLCQVKNNSYLSVYTPEYICSAFITTQLLTRKCTSDDLGCLSIIVKLQLYKVKTVILDSYQGE